MAFNGLGPMDSAGRMHASFVVDMVPAYCSDGGRPVTFVRDRSCRSARCGWQAASGKCRRIEVKTLCE